MLKLMYTGSETGIYSYPILTWHQKIKSIKAAITMHSHTHTHIHNLSMCVLPYTSIIASIVVVERAEQICDAPQPQTMTIKLSNGQFQEFNRLNKKINLTRFK